MKRIYKSKNILVYFIFFLITIGLLVRGKYGFCWSDEAYYVSATNRFLNGDRIITDDWFLSQLFSLILLPIIYVYRLILGSMDGIYLFLRIMYVLTQTFIAIAFYKVLLKNEIEKISCFLAFLMILFYCKAYICTLSYYSVIFQMFMLMLLLLYDNRNYKRLKAVGIGICFVVITIINPYFSIIYLLFLLFFITQKVIIKNKKVKKLWIQDYNLLFVYSFISILVGAFYVISIIFKNNTIGEILKCIPIILKEDGYNYDKGLLYHLINPILNVAERYKYTIIIYSLSLLYSFYLLKRNTLTEKKRLLIFIFNVLIFILNCIPSGNWNGGIQTAYALLGLQVFIICKNKNWRIFIYFYISGLIMAIMMNLSSDTAFNAMTLGFVISGAASCIFMIDFIKEVKKEWYKNFIIWIGILSICIAVIIPGFFRIYVVYRDSTLINLTTEITKGPAKGLWTTYEHNQQYEEVLSVMNTYCKGDGMVFISSWCPWAYLCTDMKCAAYTTWNIKMEKNEEKLRTYYKMYPERVPDVVIQLNDEIGKIDILNKFKDIEWLSTKPQADSKRDSSFLWKYLEKNNYERIPVKCGVVYRKK